MAIEHRLALSIFSATEDVRCSCGKVVDNCGFLLLLCMCDGNPERTHIHDAVRDEVANFCKACDLNARVYKEEQVDPGVSRRRNDVEISGWNEGGGDLWLDVVTVVPMKQDTVNAASVVAGVAATNAEGRKDAKYLDLVRSTEPRPTFVPLAWETGGRWGDKATRFFRGAVGRMGGTRSEKASFLSYWMLRFSVRFVKAVVGARSRREARFSAAGDRSSRTALVFEAFFAEPEASPFPVRGDP